MFNFLGYKLNSPNIKLTKQRDSFLLMKFLG